MPLIDIVLYEEALGALPPEVDEGEDNYLCLVETEGVGPFGSPLCRIRTIVQLHHKMYALNQTPSAMMAML